MFNKGVVGKQQKMTYVFIRPNVEVYVMSRILSIGVILAIGLILLFSILWSGASNLDDANPSGDPAALFADHKSNLKPVYIDFTKPGWERGLHFSGYSVEKDHFYRVNFEPKSIKQSDNGIRLVMSEADGRKNWDWNSAEIQMRRKTGYGYYNVLMKPAAGSGLISSFFTYTGPYYGDPHDEVDIEFLGKNLDQVEFNTHANGNPFGSVRYELGYNASEEFHLYGFDWQPGSVKFYLDGEFVHEISGPKEDMPQYAGLMMINFWTGTITEWHGEPDFEAGVAAHYLCMAYRPNGHSTSPLCAKSVD